VSGDLDRMLDDGCPNVDGPTKLAAPTLPPIGWQVQPVMSDETIERGSIGGLQFARRDTVAMARSDERKIASQAQEIVQQGQRHEAELQSQERRREQERRQLIEQHELERPRLIEHGAEQQKKRQTKPAIETNTERAKARSAAVQKWFDDERDAGREPMHKDKGADTLERLNAHLTQLGFEEIREGTYERELIKNNKARRRAKRPRKRAKRHKPRNQ
jgi:hypothetical protein